MDKNYPFNFNIKNDPTVTASEESSNVIQPLDNVTSHFNDQPSSSNAIVTIPHLNSPYNLQTQSPSTSSLSHINLPPLSIQSSTPSIFAQYSKEFQSKIQFPPSFLIQQSSSSLPSTSNTSLYHQQPSSSSTSFQSMHQQNPQQQRGFLSLKRRLSSVSSTNSLFNYNQDNLSLFQQQQQPSASSSSMYDPRYLERRSKNNAAVKKCRQIKKQQEIDTMVALKREQDTFNELTKQVVLYETEVKILEQLIPQCKKNRNKK